MNQAAEPITSVGDFYVPTFELTLKRRAAPKDVIRDVISVTYKDDIANIDSFELTINNWDAENRRFKYSDDKLFDPGTEVELRVGYFGQPQELMIAGEITSLRPSFPSGGQPTLTVSGLNILHRFRGEQRSEPYTDTTDSEVAQLIAKRLKTTIDTPGKGETRHAYLIQDNVYDIVFLLERARANDYQLIVNPTTGKLLFGPSQQQKRPAYELFYGRTLTEFQPNLTTANQVGKVIVRGWDATKKTTIKYEATQNDLAIAGLDTDVIASIQKSYTERKEVVATRIVESEEEARRLAIETLQQIAKGLVTGTGSTVGLPKLRAGSVVMIGGIGTRFSGRYFVTDTTHTIGDSGYTTQFSCRREEVKS
jgi:uncharacterized protein